AKCTDKLVAVHFTGIQLGGNVLQRFVHLQRVLYGLQRLVAQQVCPAIPKELIGMPCCIEHAHSLPFTMLALYPYRKPGGICKAMRLQMTTGASLATVFR